MRQPLQIVSYYTEHLSVVERSYTLHASIVVGTNQVILLSLEFIEFSYVRN